MVVVPSVCSKFPFILTKVLRDGLFNWKRHHHVKSNVNDLIKYKINHPLDVDLKSKFQH